MKKSIKKNYLYNLLYQVLKIIIPLITIPYLSRILGSFNIGIYGYTTSIATYFILFGSLGISLYGQREIAYVQDDKEKRSKVFFELLLLRLFTMIISLIIFYIFFIRNSEYGLFYKILSIEIFANIFDISWYYQGIENFKKVVTRSLLFKLIGTIAIFIFVKNKNDLNLYLIIYSLEVLLGYLFMWFGINNEIVIPKKINVFKHFKYVIRLFIPQIAIQVYTVLDKTMIGVITKDMNEVGYYESSQKVIKVLIAIITSLGVALMPRIALYFSSGNKEKINDYMYKAFNFILMLAIPISFGVSVTANNFVPFFFGEGFEAVSKLMIIISSIIIFIGLSNLIGTQYLLPTKREKEYTISVLSGAIINLILNYFLIKKYSSIGASIATVIAELLVVSIQLYFVRNDFDIKKILKMSFKYLISGIIMFCICLVINKYVHGYKVCLLTEVVSGVFIYFGMLLLLKDSLVLELFNKYVLRGKK